MDAGLRRKGAIFTPQFDWRHGTTQAKIQIGFGEHLLHHYDVLVNLTDLIPLFFSRFDRVLEVVIQDEAILDRPDSIISFIEIGVMRLRIGICGAS